MTAKPMLRRALLSVADKTGLVDFAGALHARGVALIASGGTHAALAEAGLPVTEVSALTGFPEMMDGRVKTLHPKIHGGLLADRAKPAHLEALLQHAIAPIDLVAVSLYPFEDKLAHGADDATLVETIDIGGPALIRAAAKNHASVTTLVDAADYPRVLEALESGEAALATLRRSLAAKAFARTAAYDSLIASWLAARCEAADTRWFSLGGTQRQTLRYGENPHQSAALYQTGERRAGALAARQVQGKDLSYNNINDTDAAFELVAEFDPRQSAAVAIIKHANPCGVGTGTSLRAAYEKALRCDPVSAFGGVVALNQRLDEDAAQAITAIFTEVIIAPDASHGALAILAAKKNLRLLLTGGLPDPRAKGVQVKSVAGGFLVQSRDNASADDLAFQVVTRRAPSPREMADLRFAFKVAKHVKSNTIVYALQGATVGIGAGQMSRVDAARIAALKSVDAAAALGQPRALTFGSVAASDAFFPFADGLQVIVEAGATAVVQPGGSVRDAEVIAAADEAGIAMVFTGTRHFRH